MLDKSYSVRLDRIRHEAARKKLPAIGYLPLQLFAGVEAVVVVARASFAAGRSRRRLFLAARAGSRGFFRISATGRAATIAAVATAPISAAAATTATAAITTAAAAATTAAAAISTAATTAPIVATAAAAIIAHFVFATEAPKCQMAVIIAWPRPGACAIHRHGRVSCGNGNGNSKTSA